MPFAGESFPAPAGSAAFSPAVSRRLKLFFLVSFGVLAAVDLVFLDQIPWGATVDDGTYAAASYSFVRTGRAGWPMMKGLFGLERDHIGCGRIWAAMLGGSQLLFGATSFAARLPGLLVVAASVGLVYRLACEAALAPPLALGAALLWFASVPARLLAHSVRPEGLVMLIFLGAVLLLFRALSHPSWPRFFLAGCLAGLSLEAHLVGSSAIAALAAAAGLFSSPGQRVRNAALVAAGAVPPVLLWLWVHAWSQPDLWRWQWDGLLRLGAAAPVLEGPAAVVQHAARRYTAYFWGPQYHRYLVELFFMLAAVVLSWRESRLRMILGLLLLFHFFLALLAALPHAGYMLAAHPLACVLIAATLWGSAHRTVRLAGTSLVAFYLLHTAYWVARRDPPLPRQVSVDVRRHVGGATFLIADNLWFHFPESANTRTVTAVNFFPFYAPGLPPQAALDRYLRQEKVQFVVEDKVFRTFISRHPSALAFFAERATLIRQYDYGTGWIRIYRLLQD